MIYYSVTFFLLHDNERQLGSTGAVSKNGIKKLAEI